MTDRDYATVPEAARRLDVHEDTIRRWIDRGILDAYKVGPRLTRIPLASLTALEEATDA